MQRGKQRETVSNPVTGIDAGAARSRDTPASPAATSPAKASPPADTTAAKASRPRSGCEPGEPNGQEGTLRDEVREALRNVLHSSTASAAAVASAGRTLLEFYGEASGTDSGGGRRSSELTAGELDAEIDRLTASRK
jgi:hypothetical protein